MICIKYLKRGFYNERRISGKLFRIMDVTRKNVYESQINEVVAADFGIRFLVCTCFNTVPLYYQQKTTVDIGEYMPEVSQMLNDKELQQIAKTASYSKDEYSFKNSQVLKNEKGRLMGINLPKKQVDKAKSAVVMCDKFFYLRDRKVTYKIFITKNMHRMKAS